MAEGDALATWVASCLLLSLRIAPVFMFAPPFTLMRAPRAVLALLGLGLSGLLVSGLPGARLESVDGAVLAVGALRELFLGLVPVVVLQLLFGAFYIAGRTLDIQSGYGLALLIDPTTRTQTPLVGSLLAYVAGATFFAMDGHLALLRVFAESLRAVPLGAEHAGAGLAVLAAYVLAVMLLALGVAGAAIAALFLTDLAVAMLSRTVPQMNALLLGIQVKSMLLLAVLPVMFGATGALFAEAVALALAVLPRLM